MSALRLRVDHTNAFLIFDLSQLIVCNELGAAAVAIAVLMLRRSLRITFDDVLDIFDGRTLFAAARCRIQIGLRFQHDFVDARIVARMTSDRWDRHGAGGRFRVPEIAFDVGNNRQ